MKDLASWLRGLLVVPAYGDIRRWAITRQLLATAKSLGKTKLILDLLGNPGGTVVMAYDTFHQIFPTIIPVETANFCAQDIFNWAGEVATSFFANVSLGNATEQDYMDGFTSPFVYRDQLDESGAPFASWADFYGPNLIHGDNFTGLMQYNLSDRWSRNDLDVYGYGNDTKFQPTTFDAEDVVLLTDARSWADLVHKLTRFLWDGICASTCAVFAELMKTHAGVRSIAVGGRAQEGPMQTIGGVKGANVFDNSAILNIVASTYEAANADQRSWFDTVKSLQP